MSRGPKTKGYPPSSLVRDVHKVRVRLGMSVILLNEGFRFGSFSVNNCLSCKYTRPVAAGLFG